MKKSISNAGIQLIAEFEGKKNKAYLCSAKYLTIGVGHNIDANNGKILKEVIGEKRFKEFETNKDSLILTEEEIGSLLSIDLTKYNLSLQKVLENVELDQWEFDALLSLAFNIGVTAFKNSTIVKHLISKKPKEQIAHEFLRWSKINNKTSIGLLNRRYTEAAVFLGGNFTLLEKTAFWKNLNKTRILSIVYNYKSDLEAYDRVYIRK